MSQPSQGTTQLTSPTPDIFSAGLFQRSMPQNIHRSATRPPPFLVQRTKRRRSEPKISTKQNASASDVVRNEQGLRDLMAQLFAAYSVAASPDDEDRGEARLDPLRDETDRPGQRLRAFSKVPLMAPVRFLTRPCCCPGWNHLLTVLVLMLFAAAVGLIVVPDQGDDEPKSVTMICLFALFFAVSLCFSATLMCMFTHPPSEPNSSSNIINSRHHAYNHRRTYQYPARSARRAKRRRYGMAKEDVAELFARSREVKPAEDSDWQCAICLEKGGGGVIADNDYDEEAACYVSQRDKISTVDDSNGGFSAQDKADGDSATRHAVELKCGHRFDRVCLAAWLSRASTCPICVCDLTLEHGEKQRDLGKHSSAIQAIGPEEQRR